jgi:N-acylglucosamine 2-epimerase
MSYATLYYDELVQEVIPFWEQYSVDSAHGGFFSCIDATHQVFDTDKFVWLQCRQVWMFATLYEEIKTDDSWIQLAEKGASFLLQYAHDGNYNWYFSLNREGQPLTHPSNIFSYTFACLCMAKLYHITKENKYKEACLETLKKIHQREKSPKAQWDKSFAGTRPLKNFALPMILCNLYNEMGTLLDEDLKKEKASNCVEEIFRDFWDNSRGVILENISSQASFSNSFEGRLINPGHGLEAMWFIMDLSKQYGRTDWMDKSLECALSIIEKGWDQKHQGIFYFLDAEGHPPLQLEWDQKLWWVHLEAMLCFLKGYELTQKQTCLEWFEKIHAYTWSHFRDPVKGGEWFGYLNREGKVLLPLKGGKWKGCFHVPRALLKLHQLSSALQL